jgi:putative ABC transport system permease protein
MQTWIADIRYARRKLFSGSGVGGTLVAIFSIGLGVGVSAAIFGAVDRILLVALPYPEPQRVTVIEQRTRDDLPRPVAYGAFVEIEERNRSFEALAVTRDWQPVLVSDSEPARLDGNQVSPDYFRVLGVPPSLGRDFVAADEVSGGPRVAIVTAGFALRRFGSAEAVLNRTILLDREEHTVIGVMPQEFENAFAPAVEIWAPLRLRRQAPFEGEEWGFQLRMVGRLRAGVPLDQAQRELTTLAASQVDEFPRPDWAELENGFAVERLQASVTSEARPALLAILGAVLLLLAIACANVTNILLARALARRGELAMRAVLGAGRGRLVQQLFAESALLALLGGALGVAIAALVSRALIAVAPDTLPRLGAIGFDGRVFGFAVATTVVVALVVGVVPAIRARGGVEDARLHVGARSTTPGLLVVRRALVVAQVALATVLLASAGLLLRSVERILTVPAGFDASQTVAMQVVATGTGIRSSAEAQVLYEQVLEAVRAVPGVVEAALTNQLPLSGSMNDRYGVVMESTRGDPASTIFLGDPFRYTVTPRWFATMGIPLMRGRLLGPEDVRDAPQAILVNESFVAARFGGRDPIGQRVRIGGNVGRPDTPPATIVGVVGDVRHTSLASAPSNAFYVAMAQWSWVDSAQTLVVRTTGNPVSFVQSIKQAVWSVNSALPVTRITTMVDLVAQSEVRRTFALAVFAAFGLAALLLAGVGVYGVMEERVTERTREIGLRSALGATPARLAALVVGQGLGLTAIGLVLGVLTAAGATQLIASLLFGIEPFDPVTYAGVVALLIGVAFIACYAPASRAARVDPAITLRADG